MAREPKTQGSKYPKVLKTRQKTRSKVTYLTSYCPLLTRGKPSASQSSTAWNESPVEAHPHPTCPPPGADTTRSQVTGRIKAHLLGIGVVERKLARQSDGALDEFGPTGTGRRAADDERLRILWRVYHCSVIQIAQDL